MIGRFYPQRADSDVAIEDVAGMVRTWSDKGKAKHRFEASFRAGLPARACGSKVLLETHAAVFDKYLRYQMVAVIFRGEIAASQHQKLLDCALARDHATAQKILVDHVQGCVEHALARGTDWVTTSSSRRVTTPADADGGTRNDQVSRRAGRPARNRASSA